METTDEYGDQFELATLVRRVTSVTEPSLRRRQVARHVTTVDPTTVADHFQTLFQRGARGDRAAAEVLMSFADFVVTASDEENAFIDHLDLAARASDRHAVSWFLLSPPPARRIDGTQRMRMRGKAMTLGERRALAAGWNPSMLEVLLADPDPMVVDRLCRNPRVQEPHIMQIVTRRPNAEDILLTIARHPRWFSRVRVRHALAMNPYGSTGLSLRIIPLLPVDRVYSIRNARDLHPALPLAASYFIALREMEHPDGPTPEDLAAELAGRRRGAIDPYLP